MLWIYVISDLKGKKLLEHFTKKNCKKQSNSKKVRVDRVITRKGNELFGK